MKTVNIHEAKTHLSRWIELAVGGEPFIIAKAGKPMVKVTAVGVAEPAPVRRLGFLAGQFKIPEDFDTMAQQQIEDMFQGKP